MMKSTEILNSEEVACGKFLLYVSLLNVDVELFKRKDPFLIMLYTATVIGRLCAF